MKYGERRIFRAKAKLGSEDVRRCRALLYITTRLTGHAAVAEIILIVGGKLEGVY
jgi:hypothetical protein